MRKPAGRVWVVLGTGGTIAGRLKAGEASAYDAAQVGVADLVAGVFDRAGVEGVVETHQLAQIDSKDIGWPVWRDLTRAVLAHLARPEVGGVVITHGTDTLEETACLLQALLPPGKPVVLTAAMRPADSPEADGPANLRDAFTVAAQAREEGHSGVVAVLQGRVWAGCDVRKVHTTRLDAFDGGGAEALAQRAALGPWCFGRPWPAPLHAWSERLSTLAHLPRVSVLTSHGDADAHLIGLLRADAQARGTGPQGLVLACTGHGTFRSAWEEGLRAAAQDGWPVVRASRVVMGGVAGRPGDEWPTAGAFTPAQARVLLALSLALSRPGLLSEMVRAAA